MGPAVSIGAIYVLTFVGGMTGTIVWDWEKRHGDDEDKRDLSSTSSKTSVGAKSDIIVQLNATGLRHRDFRRLQNLQVDVVDVDTAVVSGKDFEVVGNVTLHEEEAAPGLRTGRLSFWVPGLVGEMSGQLVFVNQTAADNKTKADFDNAHGQLVQMPAGFLTGPTEEIAKAAEEVVCEAHAEEGSKVEDDRQQ